MLEELPKHYDPNKTQSKWYTFWEEGGFFKANPLSDRDPYCVILPPPNVTGALHIGHAFIDTLQDVIIRYRRMCGLEAVWIPGVDHAGISTQTVVEKHLMKKEGKRRKEYARTDFLNHVWQWKAEHEEKIISQLKQLGCSCDWTLQRFTMDEGSNRAVRLLFKRMYDEGLIYQGDYLVNWDPITQTALADDEVEYEEQETYLWHVKYPIEGEKGHVTIATTRPETLLGDVAVAVAKGDKRYEKLVGKRVVLPLTRRKIPLLADPSVDSNFGTGAVKVTPAHDPNDYEIARRHKLELINLLSPDGTFNENGLQFEGLSVKEARSLVVASLKKGGLLEKVEPYTNRVGVSYRSKGIIEPYLSKQWFVRMSAFKEDLIQAVTSGAVKFIPKQWEQTYFHWIENLRDWCISRQLWWGHQIPIWYHREQPERILCFAEGDLPPEVKGEPNKWKQDEDVLDTWFSSALWPFSTLGWPCQTDELKKFYPNATLITGHDILFFWVARMIMMGRYVMKRVPFFEVNIQGLIFGKSYWQKDREGGITYVDSHQKKEFDLGKSLPKGIFSKWEKMSKSKGNVIDPIEVIKSYGIDALRMSLGASATHAAQIDLDFRRFEKFKHFTNKVWNGSRFVLIHLSDLSSEDFRQGIGDLALEDRWILSRLNSVIQKMHLHFSEYHFDRAAKLCYFFFWNEFCAYYLEMAKPALSEGASKGKDKKKLLSIILLAAIRLMHPFAPFITEEVFHLLKSHFTPLKFSESDPYTQEAIKALISPACIVAPYPQVICLSDIDQKIEEKFEFLNKIVYEVRTIRAEIGLPPRELTDLIVEGKEEEIELLKENQRVISPLARIRSIKTESRAPLMLSAGKQVGSLKFILPLSGAHLDKEKKRLAKEREKKKEQSESLKKKLSLSQFISRAPREVVDQTKDAFEKLEAEIKTIDAKLVSLSDPKN